MSIEEKRLNLLRMIADLSEDEIREVLKEIAKHSANHFDG